MPGQKKRALNEGDGDGINDNYNQEVDRENFVCTIDISAARRHVQPYYFNHSTYSKGRWWNRPLLDVYTGEYRNYSVDYYREAILAGRIRVNNQRMSPDYIVREGDLLTHRTHRHEPPVLLPVAIKDYQKCTVKDDDDEGNGDGDGDDAERWMFRKLLIIHEDDELVVVNKPASIPVHPSGQYHYNTITCLLSNYYGRSVYGMIDV
jgi:23S rRNA-/tRNA-specific pseudouridylate synthase